MLRLSLMTLAITLVLAGCNKDKQNDAKEGASAALTDQPLLVTQEDLLLIHSNALSSGPVITGSVEPERKADLRAELSSVVLQVFKENGETVKRGDLLVRLDDTSIKDSLHSAEEAERAAVQTFDQAERQFQRLKTLRRSVATIPKVIWSQRKHGQCKHANSYNAPKFVHHLMVSSVNVKCQRVIQHS